MESKDNLGVNCTYTGDSMRNNSDPLISVNEGFVNGFIISEVREMRQELVSIAYNTRVITRKDQEDILYNIIEESIRKIRRKQDSARLELAQLVHLLSIDRREIFKLSRLSESVIFEKGALEPCRLCKVKELIELLQNQKMLKSYFDSIAKELIWGYNDKVVPIAEVHLIDSDILDEEEEFTMVKPNVGSCLFRANDNNGNGLTLVDITSKGLKEIIKMEKKYQERPDVHYESALYNELRNRLLAVDFFIMGIKTIKTSEAVFLFDIAEALDIISIKENKSNYEKKEYIKVQLPKTNKDIFGKLKS